MVALAGFHIKRQEFEPEYDNEAEMIVADMEFRDDDTEVGLHACTFPSDNKPDSINNVDVFYAFWIMIVVVVVVIITIVIIIIICVFKV